MNTRNKALLSIALTLLVAAPLAAQQPRVASSGGVSPHETISTVIGDRRTGDRITISYGRPYSKDPLSDKIRKIFGTGTPKEFVVPYGKAWRMGSDEATLLITQQPIVMGDLTIPPGAYTLYLLPMETGDSKLAISTNIGKWGIPVDETHDLGRVDAKKETSDKSVGQFTMAIEKDPANPAAGIIKMMWETTVFSVPFTVKK